MIKSEVEPSSERKRKLRIDDDDDDDQAMGDDQTGHSVDEMQFEFDQAPKLKPFLSSAAKKIKLEEDVAVPVAPLESSVGHKMSAAVKSSKKVVDKYRRLGQKGPKKRKNDWDVKEEVEFPFQRVLVQYLEQKALELTGPVDDPSNGGLAFASLTALFHMFIYCRLFSHDQFVCDLIAKGESFRANYGDIKRPISVFMNHARNRQQKMQQQLKLQQMQNQQAAFNSQSNLHGSQNKQMNQYQVLGSSYQI